YKSIVLQNGLTVLLISDKSVSSNVVVMSVKFGSFDDPFDMQGLAHMIEHMFFSGSTTNHGENEFKDFVMMNGEFEYQKSKDSSRMKQPFAHTSPKDHPFNRFTWGNNQSFSGQEPKALRDCAMKLFRKHFIGASMKLIIIDSESVNELEDSVIEYLSKLKRGQKINFVFSKYKDPLWKHGVLYTLEFLESEGTICFLFKCKHWITSFNASV
ncbi:unnamed protein product, partial [Brassica oleracea]